MKWQGQRPLPVSFRCFPTARLRSRETNNKMMMVNKLECSDAIIRLTSSKAAIKHNGTTNSKASFISHRFDSHSSVISHHTIAIHAIDHHSNTNHILRGIHAYPTHPLIQIMQHAQHILLGLVMTLGILARSSGGRHQQGRHCRRAGGERFD